MKNPRTLTVWTAALSVSALAMTACTNGDDSDEQASEEITFWTLHNTPAREAVQQQVAADFEEETGITVHVVGMDAADMNQSVVAGAAAGDLPDVALIGPDQVASWASQGVLDADASEETLTTLDASTFSTEAVDLVTIEGQASAVPSDGWGSLLYYRADVFDELGLDAPENVEDVVAAAEAISESDTDMAGIVLGTQPADAMAREVLEHLGLANGCEMFEGDEVALESAACVQTMADYQALAEASVPGDQDVESTRAAYLAGDAAMVIWSPHLLDEVAGLDPNFPVSAEGVGDDPQFLSQNTGVVGGLMGVANDEPTGYGLTMNYGILQGAETEAAQRYVEYVMSEGYIDTLAMTPEGRIPVRQGSPEDPEEFGDAWGELELGIEAGVEEPLPFAELYSEEVVDEVVDAANNFTRWGFGTEHWATAGAAVTQNSLVTDVNMLLDGGDPEAYAEHIADTVRTLQQENQ